MIRKAFLSVLVCCLIALILAPSVAEAFDGVRKGFILGFGAGFGATKFKQEVTVLGATGSSDWENKGGVATDFKIGYAFDEQIQLYWSARGNWFGITNAFGSSVTILNGVAGPGMTYHFRTTVPSWYVFGSLGYSTWSLPFEDGASTWYGFGATMGGGYEFSRHWSVDVTLAFTNPSDEEFGIKATTTATSVKVCINVLAY